MKLNQGTDVGVKKISHKGAKGTKKYLNSKLQLCELRAFVGKELLLPEIKRNGNNRFVIGFTEFDMR